MLRFITLTPDLFEMQMSGRWGAARVSAACFICDKTWGNISISGFRFIFQARIIAIVIPGAELETGL